MKTTFDDLVDLLRSCPPEQLPATPESATSPDRPPENSQLRTQNSALTTLGTPAAHSWDDAWLDVVNAAESRLGRRICGARFIDGTPCELGFNHPTGRCRLDAQRQRCL